MKFKVAFVCLMTALLAGAQLKAENIAFPEEGEPFLTLNIPDGWNPAFDEDGTLGATDPDEEVQVVMWELADKEDLESLESDIDGIIAEYAVDVKAEGEAEELTINEIPGVLIKGKGKEKDGDRELGFEVLILKPVEGKAVVLYLDYYTDASKDLIDTLVKILTTVKPIKG